MPYRDLETKRERERIKRREKAAEARLSPYAQELKEDGIPALMLEMLRMPIGPMITYDDENLDNCPST